MKDYLITGVTSAVLLLCGAIVQAAADEHAGHLPKIGDGRSSVPMLLPQRGRSRSEKGLRLKGMAAAEVRVFGPDDAAGRVVPLDMGAAKIESRGPRQGGYHWVGAQQVRGGRVDTANTLVYFSNPGPAPRDMLAAHKGVLDIGPVELPREHRHFRANEAWDFRVRLHGEPLAGAVVLFRSDNGSEQRLRSNAKGEVTLRFPDDFSAEPEQAGGHGQGHQRRRKSGFVVSVAHADGEQRLRSSFNYHYTPGAFYNKDLTLGAGFALLGMVSAAPLLRRRKKEVGK